LDTTTSKKRSNLASYRRKKKFDPNPTKRKMGRIADRPSSFFKIVLMKCKIMMTIALIALG